MATWLLTVGGVTKTIGGWGINADSLLKSAKSFESDTLSFEMTAATVVGEPVFADRAPAILTRDGVRVFVGKIREDIVELDAFTQVQKYVIKNAWDDLEHCPYKQDRTVKDTVANTFSLFSTTRLFLGARTGVQTVTKITTKNQMEDLLAFAVADGIELAYDVNFTGLTPPYQEAKGLTVAAAMRVVVGVIADMFTWMDYTTLPYPTLYMRRRSSVTPTTIDLSNYSSTVGLVSVKPLKPLRELYADSVEINFESSALDPVTGSRYASFTQQFAGTQTPGGYNLKATFLLAGQGTTDPEATPAALAAAYRDALSQPYYQTTLGFHHLAIPGTYRPGFCFNFTGTVDGVAVRAAWGTAAAIAQVVHEQLFRGITTVECGAPPMLNTATFKELQSKLAAVSSPAVPSAVSGISDTASGPSSGYRVQFVSGFWLKSDTSTGGFVSVSFGGYTLAPGDTSGVLAAGSYPLVFSFYLFGYRFGFSTAGPLVLGGAPSSSPIIWASGIDAGSDGLYSGEFHFNVLPA